MSLILRRDGLVGDRAPYPSTRHHATLDSCIVRSREEDEALSDTEWSDTPAAFHPGGPLEPKSAPVAFEESEGLLLEAINDPEPLSVEEAEVVKQEKPIQRCKLCKQPGHNKRNCPTQKGR
jgi:hypothetical protein